MFLQRFSSTFQSTSVKSRRSNGWQVLPGSIDELLILGPITLPVDTELQTAVVAFRDTFLINVGSRTLAVAERIFDVYSRR